MKPLAGGDSGGVGNGCYPETWAQAAMDFESITLRLARRADAERIALMSRELIETGLPWSWTPNRVVRSIRCRDTVTVVADHHQRVIGFAVMYFGLDDAHLHLLAVQREYRRSGLGRRLLAWLSESAVVAGIETIYLEVRVYNHAARCFYRRLGFRETAYLPGYYGGREPAMRMARELRSPVSPAPR